jgi:hypothetical protein
MPSSQDALSGAAVEHFEDLRSHAKSYKNCYMPLWITGRKMRASSLIRNVFRVTSGSTDQSVLLKVSAGQSL